MSETIPWVEKYRPGKLQDLVSHQDIISTIQRFVDENKLPHLLLYGPPGNVISRGTGKTSTILACAKDMYGPEYQSMVLELNASDDRGIDVVRNQIKDFASTKCLSNRGEGRNVKLIVLDEADQLTSAAQNSLRRVIEKFTKNTRFCLVCNYVGKIIPALQSRCTRFRFSPVPLIEMQDRLNLVVEQEHVKITPEGISNVLKLSNGDMRRMLNVLQVNYLLIGLPCNESISR